MPKKYQFSQTKEEIQSLLNSISEQKEELEGLIAEARQLKSDLVAMRGDNDTTDKIDTLNEVITALDGIDNDKTLIDIMNDSHQEISDDEMASLKALFPTS